MEILVFEYSAEGGGAAVYRRDDRTVYEEGESGGLLEDEEDPLQEWRHEYADWAAFWNQFSSHRLWYQFSPLYVHPDYRPAVREAIEAVVWPPDSDRWMQQVKMADWQRLTDDASEAS